MKVLVTGGAGFIGSHLAEALVRRGAQVILIDDFSQGSEQNLAWIGANDSIEVVRGNAGDRVLLDRCLNGVECVFHQAAIPSVPRSITDPLLTHRQNLDACLELLVAARDARVRRFVFASSSSIYGEHPAPFKTESLPPQPLSPYALQKLAAEEYARLFHSLYGLGTVSLRYFNVFGPRQAFDSAYSGVIARFCTAFLAQEPPTIFGDGRQTRDFTYVENVVAANLRAAETDNPKALGRTFNVANGVGIDLLQLVDGLRRLTGLELSPRFEPARSGDIRHSCADIRAAQTELAYAPKVDWEEGLRRTVDWYRSQSAAGKRPQ